MTTRSWIVLIVFVLVSAAGVAGLRRERSSSLSTTVVTRGTFIDFLQIRGEIRPVRSVILTAPSSGADLSIVQLAKNGSPVAAGDVVVQFDPTTQQRTLEQKQSELKQAESEIEKARAEQKRRVQAAETELVQARSAADRARLDVAKSEVISRIDAEKYALAL